MSDQRDNPYASPQCELPQAQDDVYPSRCVDAIGMVLFILGPFFLFLGIALANFELTRQPAIVCLDTGFMCIAVLAAMIFFLDPRK